MRSCAPRLLFALNQGTYSETTSHATGSARDGSLTLAASPTSEITVTQSDAGRSHDRVGCQVVGLATRAGAPGAEVPAREPRAEGWIVRGSEGRH
ncbi:MAG: hypothetical protein WAN22_29430 [Solirubrobacteraceae bacterium]